MPNCFTAEQAEFEPTQNVWKVPVVLAYPNLGILGQVGEVIVSSVSEEIVSHASINEMKQAGQNLVNQYCTKIQVTFS